jgi:hypothetical protein
VQPLDGALTGRENNQTQSETPPSAAELDFKSPARPGSDGSASRAAHSFPAGLSTRRAAGGFGT